MVPRETHHGPPRGRLTIYRLTLEDDGEHLPLGSQAYYLPRVARILYLCNVMSHRQGISHAPVDDPFGSTG